MPQTAIIIEPRRHRALWFVLDNALTNLSEDWKIVLFHGTTNTTYAKEIELKINSPRLQLVQLPVEDLNQMSYSKLLATKSVIYDYIDTEYFLVFQTDSMILKEHKDVINEFLAMDIDYVGAPWAITQYPLTVERDFIGNGGFSLRKTSAMKRFMEVHPWDPGDIWHEDLYFTKPVKEFQMKKPPYLKAKEFCIDEVNNGFALSVHRPWCHGHFESLKERYPEIAMLHELQGVE